MGDDYPRSWAEQRWTVVKANLRERIPDGMMMRVSLIGNSDQEALAVLSSFTASFIAASPAPLRKLLIS
jgi:hypothetical protein